MDMRNVSGGMAMTQHRCGTCGETPFQNCRTHACTCEALFVNDNQPRCVMYVCVQSQQSHLLRCGQAPVANGTREAGDSE